MNTILFLITHKNIIRENFRKHKKETFYFFK